METSKSQGVLPFCVRCVDATNSSMPISLAIKQDISHCFARQSAAFPSDEQSRNRAIGHIGEQLNSNPFTHPKPGGPAPRVSRVSGFPQSQFLLQDSVSSDNSICNASPAFPLPMRSWLARPCRGGPAMKRQREGIER